MTSPRWRLTGLRGGGSAPRAGLPPPSPCTCPPPRAAPRAARAPCAPPCRSAPQACAVRGRRCGRRTLWETGHTQMKSFCMYLTFMGTHTRGVKTVLSMCRGKWGAGAPPAADEMGALQAVVDDLGIHLRRAHRGTVRRLRQGGGRSGDGDGVAGGGAQRSRRRRSGVRCQSPSPASGCARAAAPSRRRG
jgi:hypothetical protein